MTSRHITDPFEKGFDAYLLVHATTKLPPICPYDPAEALIKYEEWFAGYEYSAYLSSVPEKKIDKEFGPFKKLLE